MAVLTASGRWHLARALVRDFHSPASGLAGQAVRFAISGGLVAIVNVSVTTSLHDALAVRFQIALAIGTVTSVALHFTLQRRFVWRHQKRFALAMQRQAVRYLLLSVTQYGLVALATSQLPDALGMPVELVYITALAALAGVNFVLFRGRVFHADQAPRAATAPCRKQRSRYRA